VGISSPLFFYKIMKDSIIDIVEKFVKSKGLMFIDCTVRGERATKVLEVYIDDVDALSFDSISKINSELWEEIEAKELSEGISKVIVSSPGVDKTFKYPEQMFKHIGRTLDIKMKNGRVISGELTGIMNTGTDYIVEIKSVTKNGKKTDNVTETLNFGDIAESKVKLKFK